MEEYFELALESAEGRSSGVEIDEERISPRLRRLSFLAEGDLGEKGRFYTLLTSSHLLEDRDLSEEWGRGIEDTVRGLVRRGEKKVLAVGLGNPSAVVDALGAECMKRLSTGKRRRGYLATVTPSVFGLTGMETASVVKGVVREYSPDLILLVDTLATRRAERLFRAVQIGEGGIVPGGGVGNRRVPLSERDLGAPVLTIGVPLLAHADRCASLPADLVVTPKEIDLLVPAFAEMIAGGVERALFK